MTFHLLEVEVKTLQIFKLLNWLKIHYSFVTRINKHLWSYSISCTAPCPRVHTAYSAMFSFSLIVNRDFCSISLAHIHNTAAVSWRQGTAQERWKYTFLQWWKSGVSALGLPEYHLWPVFFPTTPREKKKIFKWQNCCNKVNFSNSRTFMVKVRKIFFQFSYSEPLEEQPQKRFASNEARKDKLYRDTLKTYYV